LTLGKLLNFSNRFKNIVTTKSIRQPALIVSLCLLGWLAGNYYIQKQIDSKLTSKLTNSVEFWELANNNIETLRLNTGKIRLNADYGVGDCNHLFQEDDKSRKCKHWVDYINEFEDKPILITSMMAIDLSSRLFRKDSLLIENYKIGTGYTQDENTTKGFQFKPHVWGTNWVEYMKYSWLAIEVP